MTTIRTAADPVDPALFVPWPLAPGAREGWRDNGPGGVWRFCAYVVREGDPPASMTDLMVAAHLEGWHTVTLPATDGGTVSVGEVLAWREGPRCGWGRATRTAEGLAVAGVLAAGFTPGEVRGHALGGTFGARPSPYGWLLDGVAWVAPDALPAGEGVTIQVDPALSLGAARRRLEAEGRSAKGG